MRGRRRHISSVLADALAARGRSRRATVAAHFTEIVGPLLARKVSARGVLRDGRLLVVAASSEWAAQTEALAPEIIARLRERLGEGAPHALSIHVGSLPP